MVTAPEASVSSAQAATPTPAASAKAPSPVAAADSRKRTRSASQAEEAALASIQSAVAAAAMAAAAGAADDAITESESEAAMSEVMKEVEGSAGAFEASAGAAAVVPKDENGAADDVAAVEAGAEAAAELGRSQLYESKRMARVSFSSWFEFDAYFEMYMQDTFQPFRMRSSCSVEAYRRNQQKVMMNNKNSRGRRIEFPDEAIHHHRIYMCTHAMKARCRGATTRPGQKYRGIGCIAKINVKISPSENPSKYMVIVTDQVVTHNHPISREIYEAYPDIVMKNMRRSQMGTSLLTRQPTPKFETPAQAQKYERASSVLASMAEMMARLGDEDFEAQLNTLQKLYGSAANTRTV